VEWDAHLQDRWIKNTGENLGRKNIWQSTDREAKSQVIGYSYHIFQKRTWDFRTERIGHETGKWRKTY